MNVTLTIGKGKILQIDIPFPHLLLDLAAASPLTGESSWIRESRSQTDHRWGLSHVHHPKSHRAQIVTSSIYT